MTAKITKIVIVSPILGARHWREAKSILFSLTTRLLGSRKDIIEPSSCFWNYQGLGEGRSGKYLCVAAVFWYVCGIRDQTHGLRCAKYAFYHRIIFLIPDSVTFKWCLELHAQDNLRLPEIMHLKLLCTMSCYRMQDAIVLPVKLTEYPGLWWEVRVQDS